MGRGSPHSHLQIATHFYGRNDRRAVCYRVQGIKACPHWPLATICCQCGQALMQIHTKWAAYYALHILTVLQMWNALVPTNELGSS